MIPPTERHLTWSAVMELTGESRETLLTWIQEGSFPKPDTKTSLEADPAGDDFIVAGERR